MGLYKIGNVNPKIMAGLTKGLSYITRTGTDVAIDEPSIGKERVIYKEHAFFREGEKNLPAPYRVGKYTIPKYMMDLYSIKTKIDLARYVRIISIIITEFMGPEKYDHLGHHVARLKNYLQKVISTVNKEKEMMITLLAYEQHTGARTYFHTILEEKDYYNFIRVLNTLYNLYEFVEPRSLDKKESAILRLKDIHDKRLLEMLKNSNMRALLLKHLQNNNIYEIASEKELHRLVELPEKRKELIDTINSWVKKETGGKLDSMKRSFLILYSNLTDEKLLRRLKDERSRNTLFNFLKHYGIHEVNSDKELRAYIQKDDVRAVLLKKLQDFYEKEYVPY